MCRQSLRLRGLEGVRCFGRLHHSHQGQYQNERGREPDGGGLAEQDSPGKEMVSGADDFVVDQAPESAYSLGEEGRKLAGSCSACLRPHLAQSDGFRIESKRRPAKALRGTCRGGGGGGSSLSEDREDSPKPAEEDPPTLLKRLLIGVFAGNILVFVEFGGLFLLLQIGLLGIPSMPIWESLLAMVGAGCACGVVLGFVLPLVKGEERLKQFCVFCLAGGAAGTIAWITLQPDISVFVAVGANALFF